MSGRSRRRQGLWALGVVLLPLAASCTARDVGAKVSDTESAGALLALSFDDVAVGGLPAGWRAFETRGKGEPGRWEVEEGGAGRARVLSLTDVANSGSTFNLLLSPEALPANLELSVMLRADSGDEDQGGGLVWRAKGADDYYVTRWNPLEDNLRIYVVIAGKRTQLQSADVHADPALWHELRVTAEDARMRVSFDGETLLDCQDETLAEPGLVGFWTKADAATSFDDLSIRALAN